MKISETCDVCVGRFICPVEDERGCDRCTNFHKALEEKFNSSAQNAATEDDIDGTSVQKKFNAIADALQCLHSGDSNNNEPWFMDKICEIRK